MASHASGHVFGISLEELAAALDLSNTFITTFDGEIVYWSNGSQQLYGWHREEALGRPSDTLLHTRLPQSIQTINASLAASGCWSGNLVHQAKDSRLLNIDSQWVLAPGASSPRIIQVNVLASLVQTHLASIVDSTNDAVIGETLDGIVTSWNPSAQRLFEYTASEMIGQSIVVLFPPASLDEEVRLIAKIRNGESVSHYETTRVSKSGKSLDISLTLSPIYDLAGRLVGISKIARDITDRRRNEKDLRRAHDSLEEFAYAAAHDLQEPLRNISLALQQLSALSSDLSEDERAEMMSVAVRNSNRMQELIKDLLYFTRVLNAPDFNGVDDPDSDGGQVVAEAIENLNHAIQECNACVTVDNPLPRASMHHAHLLQLMQNLIGNSLKYHQPPVPPAIRISAAQDRSQVTFCVSDNGPGIAPQFHKRIFGVFKRLDFSKPGNGIGLAVCKRIVEHYGGSIWVESQEGNGAMFYFTVPIRRKQHRT